MQPETVAFEMACILSDSSVSRQYIEHASIHVMICTFLISGWGSTNFNGTPKDVKTGNYDISETLQQTDVPLAPLEKCKDYWTTAEMFAKLNDRVFCGGEIGAKKKNVQGACYGDSGSPLICDTPTGKVFKGVLLGGHPACRAGVEYIIFADLAKEPVWV